jgi:hypothetical protein
VPGRLPGVAVAPGLAFSAVEPARTGVLALVVAGIAAAVSIRRVIRTS